MARYALLVGADLVSPIKFGIVDKASVNAAEAMSTFFKSFPPSAIRRVAGAE